MQKITNTTKGFTLLYSTRFDLFRLPTVCRCPPTHQDAYVNVGWLLGNPPVKVCGVHDRTSMQLSDPLAVVTVKQQSRTSVHPSLEMCQLLYYEHASALLEFLSCLSLYL